MFLLHCLFCLGLFAPPQVIKTVMKMDAAEPFNVPVNPIALGIPVSLSFSTLGIPVLL